MEGRQIVNRAPEKKSEVDVKKEQEKIAKQANLDKEIEEAFSAKKSKNSQ